MKEDFKETEQNTRHGHEDKRYGAKPKEGRLSVVFEDKMNQHKDFVMKNHTMKRIDKSEQEPGTTRARSEPGSTSKIIKDDVTQGFMRNTPHEAGNAQPEQGKRPGNGGVCDGNYEKDVMKVWKSQPSGKNMKAMAGGVDVQRQYGQGHGTRS